MTAVKDVRLCARTGGLLHGGDYHLLGMTFSHIHTLILLQVGLLASEEDTSIDASLVELSGDSHQPDRVFSLF